MSAVYESIMVGLNEALEDARSKKKKLPRRMVESSYLNMMEMDENLTKEFPFVTAVVNEPAK